MNEHFETPDSLSESSTPALSTAALPRVLGRSTTLDHILQTLASGRDVLVEAETGMGLDVLRAAVIEVAPLRGFALSGVAPLNDLQQLIVVDLRSESPESARHITSRAATGARIIAFARPVRPFATGTHPLQVLLRSRAVVIRLKPLTATETTALATELHRTGIVRHRPASIERHWAAATGGGFARLVESLLQDADESPELAGTLTRVSTRTIVIASEIVSALPEPLTRLAWRLLPLVGVRMSRIEQMLDRSELGLLLESHVIGEEHGHLTIALPLQGALRLLYESTELDEIQLAILVDVCTSVDVGADCSENELAVVAIALTEHAALRASIPEQLQHYILTDAMWFARRRGDEDSASTLARRVLSSRYISIEIGLKTVARRDTDNLVAYAAHLATLPPSRESLRSRIWLFCVQFPLLTAAPGMYDIVDVTSERFSQGRETVRIAYLRRSLEATELLDMGDTAGAVAIAEHLLQAKDVDEFVRYRALAIIAAANTMACDGEALALATLRMLDRVIADAPNLTLTLDGDLDRRQALDTLLVIGLCFASLGQEPPRELCAYVDGMMGIALRQGTPTTIVPLVIFELLHAVTIGDQHEVAGYVRFLRRKRNVDTAAWALALFDGTDAAFPARIGGGTFLDSITADLRFLWHDARADVVALTSTVANAPGLSDALRRLATAFVIALAGERPTLGPDLHAFPFAPGSVPAAMRDVVLGVGTDATLIRRGADTLLQRAAIPAAIAAMELAAPLVAGDREAERELRRAQREARSRRRPGASAPSGLTVREQEIAALAATGMSNRDIARHLFLSVRTVESHLYRAMRKSSLTREGLWVTLQPTDTEDEPSPQSGPSF